MDSADKFSLPVVSFVDTAGAIPESAPKSARTSRSDCEIDVERCLTLGVPMVAVIAGEARQRRDRDRGGEQGADA